MIDVSSVDLTKVYDLSARILDIYRGMLEEKKINATGTLSKTADFDVEFDEYRISVYFILESYYHYIEEGRNRSTGKFGVWLNKYSDIENWIRNKIRRGSWRGTVPKTDTEIKRAAGAIAKKITRFGYYGYAVEGKHPLRESMELADSMGYLDEIIDCILDGFDKRVESEIERI